MDKKKVIEEVASMIGEMFENATCTSLQLKPVKNGATIILKFTNN